MTEPEPIVEILASRCENGAGGEAAGSWSAGRQAAHEHLERIATGEDDRYDFAVSERLHAERR